ncbi:MAG: PKD domain-containing protein [Chitinophagaceae bacterium]|nr:MAG: PKD domain-containing protein [Chitinophagaceae bacterium]
MNCLRKLLLFFVGFLLSKQVLFAQYILNGSAQKNSCNCYTLTQPTEFQSGSVWNSNKINLNNAFDFWFNVFLGCNDVGADGMVFILQPISTSVGSSGEGMGFGGVTPSIGIALDTYMNPNLNDPTYDHISIQANGVLNHTNDLAGPVRISSTSDNVEDCQWHKLRVSWDPTTKWLRTYFDGVLRVEKQVDLITTIFNNDPNVYWGFTGATGGQVNLQQFCTALDPIFAISSSNSIVCDGTAIQFTNASESFAPISSYNWSFGDGTFSTAINPPPHTFPSPGEYQVKLKIAGQDGCERDSTRTITVAPNPSANLQVFDTCFRQSPRLALSSRSNSMDYQWLLDGKTQIDNATTIQTWSWLIGNQPFDGQTVTHSFDQASSYAVKLFALAENGCVSDTVEKQISIAAAFVQANDTTIVKGSAAQLHASGNGNFTWSPAVGLSDPLVANPIATLNNDQDYTITVTTPEGCVAEKDIRVKVFIGPAIYVPSAFTPNGDGKNDVFRPVYVGIKELRQFSVFDRWGQLVFSTKDMGKGWERPGLSGTFVWLVQAVDDGGQVHTQKGTVTIIR